MQSDSQKHPTSKEAEEQLSGVADYLKTVAGFSRNAKLLLMRGPVIGLGFGIWELLFNIYILSLWSQNPVFDEAYLSKILFWNWFFHGALVIPAGMLSDIFGRRNTYIIANIVAIILKTLSIFTLNPTFILTMRALGGIGEGFHAVVGAPFMLEHSRPKERVHLFSLSSFLYTFSETVGRMFAGFLPLWFAPMLMVDGSHYLSLRVTLACALPLMLFALIPIFMIRESWKRQSLATWWKNVQNHATMVKLAITSALPAMADGMVFLFYNVFFSRKFGATTAMIGMIFGLGSLFGSFGNILTPLFVKRLGKVNTIVLVEMLAIPFLLVLAFTSNFTVAAVCFVIHAIMTSASFPIANLFQQEIVEQNERGTINGVVHAATEFPRSSTTRLAGALMMTQSWGTMFLGASALNLAAFILYWIFFQRIETARREVAVEK